MKKTVISAVIAATALTSVPAFGDPPPWAPAHGRRAHERYEEYDRGYDGGYQRQYYRTGNGIAYWRGDDGRYYCRRSNGTTGLLIGAAAGALLGRSIDRRGDRSTGTILGAAAGALLGREVERSSARCR
ncbi:MAG: glycine zipper 2TM domain-containing protein [Novosphingobium sp.]